MYVPKHFAVDDPGAVVTALRHVAFGHLVSAGSADGPEAPALDATPLPFLVDDDVREVRAHVARANPQWRSLDGRPALLIVPVSDAYVSPSWYPSKVDKPRVVPTWNYEVVHVHGTVRVHHDAEFLDDLVRSLTAFHEARRIERGDSAPAWSVDDAPAGYIEKLFGAIVGIRLVVERVDAKRKLNQNRSLDDQAGVADALSGSTEPRSTDVARAMREAVAAAESTGGE